MTGAVLLFSPTPPREPAWVETPASWGWERAGDAARELGVVISRAAPVCESGRARWAVLMRYDAPSPAEAARIAAGEAAMVARAKAEIVADMLAGRVPVATREFSALHDHVDANMYGCVEGEIPADICDPAREGADAWIGAANRVQDAVDAWLRAGGAVEAVGAALARRRGL